MAYESGVRLLVKIARGLSDDNIVSSLGPTRQSSPSRNRWTSRPTVARLLRLVLLVFPFAISFWVTFWLAATYPPERLHLNRVLWVIGVWSLAVIALILAERVSRRLMPLSALFKLSLVFPDEAPNRFGVALRTGTTKQLERRIKQVQENGLSSEEIRSGAQLLELIAMLSTHDRMTRGHCERVRAYTDIISDEMELPEADREMLRWAALIHDVGKLFVPAGILNSPDRPTEEEWEALKSHTWLGGDLAEPLRPWLGEWLDAVRHHHERWDGGGYPDGLARTDIPLGARIVAVADAYDVMTSVRSYKKPRSAVDARAEIAACAGGQFDPQVVRAFLNIGLGRLRLALGPLTWLSNVPAVAVPATPFAPLAGLVANAAPVLAAAAVAAGSIVAMPDEPPSDLASVTDDADVGVEDPNITNSSTTVQVSGNGLATSTSQPSPTSSSTVLGGELVTTIPGQPTTTLPTITITTTSGLLPTTDLITTPTVPTTPTIPTTLPDNPPVVLGGGTFTWSAGGLSSGIVVSGSDPDGDPVQLEVSNVPSWVLVDATGNDTVVLLPVLIVSHIGETATINVRAISQNSEGVVRSSGWTPVKLSVLL